MYALIRKFRHFKICFRTTEPDLLHIPIVKQDWENQAYGSPTKDIPTDASPPLGKHVTIIAFFDANLMHDVLSGKALTGVLYFYNKTPVNWRCKVQSTSETATYGSEFLSDRVLKV